MLTVFRRSPFVCPIACISAFYLLGACQTPPPPAARDPDPASTLAVPETIVDLSHAFAAAPARQLTPTASLLSFVAGRMTSRGRIR